MCELFQLFRLQDREGVSANRDQSIAFELSQDTRDGLARRRGHRGNLFVSKRNRAVTQGTIGRGLAANPVEQQSGNAPRCCRRKRKAPNLRERGFVVVSQRSGDVDTRFRIAIQKFEQCLAADAFHQAVFHGFSSQLISITGEHRSKSGHLASLRNPEDESAAFPAGGGELDSTRTDEMNRSGVGSLLKDDRSA